MKNILFTLALLYPLAGLGTYEPVYTSQTSTYEAQVITAMSGKSLKGLKNAYYHKKMSESMDNVQFVIINDPRLELYPGQTQKMKAHNVNVILEYGIHSQTGFKYANLETKVVCVEKVRQVAGGILGIVEGFLAQVQQVIQFIQDVIGFLNGNNLIEIIQAVDQCDGQNY